MATEVRHNIDNILVNTQRYLYDAEFVTNKQRNL